MKHLAKYLSIFRITLVNSLAYPMDMLGRSLMMIPFMWIFYQLWKVTFAASGTDTLNGMTLTTTLWYLMLAETIELSRPQLARTISENVKDGSIAYLLNKPYNFLLYQFSNAMGETVFRALTNAVIGALMVGWLVGSPPPLQGWLFALVAVLGAWTMNFCITCLIGLSAFLVEDIAPFTWIYQKLVFILGGFLIPLQFYPEWLQTIAKALPFSAMIYGPAQLFVAPAWEFFGEILLMQSIWIGVFVLMLNLGYRQGMAYLAVNGG
jgi:ABC-2 type transport system permease protein